MEITRAEAAKKNAKQKPRKVKLNSFMASLFGLLWLAIALNYTHIYVVYQQTNTVEFLGVDPDDSPTRMDQDSNWKSNSKSKSNSEEEEEEEQTNFSKVVRTTKRGKRGRTKNKNKNKNPFQKDGMDPGGKRAKNAQFFLNQHNNKKELYIESQTQNATSEEHRKELEERAKQFFVDLETDEHPHIRHNISTNHQDPWLVLHIGPPKTATTAIQCGLEKLSLRLAKTDGYHYIGGGCGAEGREYIMPNGEATVLRKKILDALILSRRDMNAMGHLKEFVERTRFLREKGRSVILSSELFGSRLPGTDKIMGRLKKVLLSPSKGAGWNPEKIKIVLAYRHFVDWLPSFHYQTYSLCFRDEPFARDRNAVTTDETDPSVMPFLKYADRYLTNWEAHQNMVLEGLNSVTKGGKTMNSNSASNNDDSEENENEEALPPPPPQGEEEEEEEQEQEEDDLGMLSFLPKNRRSIHPSWWLYQLWSFHFPLPNQVEVYDMHAPMNSNRPNDDMVTNFVCNMLPGAHNTCSKLLQLEDDLEQQRRQLEDQSNGTTVANNTVATTTTSIGSINNEPNYDSLELHTRGSFLHQKKDDGNPENNNPNTNRKPKNERVKPTVTSTGNGMNVRKSSDFDAVMLVEDLLLKGEIPLFDFSKYGPDFFASEPSLSKLSKEYHKGHTKRELIVVAEKLLKEHGLKAPDEKYYDCMDQDLEDRLLKASLTFVDLMYKKTEMLTTSALASTREMAGGSSEQKKAAIEEEKEKRYQQALSEHARLFEKNKAKGKYCDISPSKVFQEIPAIHKALTALSFKPKYKSFKFERLPNSVQPHVQTLFKHSKHRWMAAHNKGATFGKLGTKELAAAFHLGWEDLF